MTQALSSNLLKPYRFVNESYEDYKKRREFTNYAVKQHLKGKLIWDSARIGTFRHDDSTLRQGERKTIAADDSGLAPTL
jgi:hypothetical protein